jgi:ABC-type transport system involved in cytochrome c biogenesis permease component
MTTLDLTPRTITGWRAGAANVFAHESRLWWRSRRWWIQLLLWAGLLNGMLLGFLWIAAEANETAIRLEEPAVGVTEIFPQFLGLTVLLSTIGVVVLTQGIMLDERRQGTLEWMLAKPVSRTGVVVAKYAAHLIPVLVIFVVVPWSGLYWLLSRELGELWPVGQFVAVAGMVALVLAFTVALTLALGTWTTSRAVVVGVPIAAGLLYDTVHLFTEGWVGRLPFPWELTGSAVRVSAGEPLISWVPVGATMIWIVVVVAATAWRFRFDDAT